MVIETALVKPDVDVLISVLEKARGLELRRLRNNHWLRQFVNCLRHRKLKLCFQDCSRKGCRIISSNLVPAEEMLAKVKISKKVAAKATAANKPAR